MPLILNFICKYYYDIFKSVLLTIIEKRVSISRLVLISICSILKSKLTSTYEYVLSRNLHILLTMNMFSLEIYTYFYL